MLDALFDGGWVWVFLAGYLIALVQCDWFDNNSWIKFTWNKWVVGVRHNLDLSRSDDQSGVPDGYERWYLVHEIINTKSQRCYDSFNTVVNIKTGLLKIGDVPIERFSVLAPNGTKEITKNNQKYTFKKKTSCLDLRDKEPVELVEFFLPENSDDKMTYRILADDYKGRFEKGPLEISGEFQVRVSCKSERYGAETGDDLLLKRKHNDLILVGNSGSFGCSACFGAKESKKL